MIFLCSKKLVGFALVFMGFSNFSGLTLREHQVKGIEKVLEWYEKGHGGILADEMGLGKTCQMICALVLLKKSIKKPKFVIICPLSVLHHWEYECSRFVYFLFNLLV